MNDQNCESHLTSNSLQLLILLFASVHLLTSCSTESDTNKYNSESKVAPVFKFGSGEVRFILDGYPGPYYLSEEDALQVIQHQFEKRGLVLTNNDVFDSISTLSKLLYYKKDENGNIVEKVDSNICHKYKPQWYCKEYNLVISYLSMAEINLSDHEEINYYSKTPSLISAGNNIRHEIKKKNKYNSVIFYDPVDYYIPYLGYSTFTYFDYDIYNKHSKIESIIALKKQIDGFLIWFRVNMLEED